MSDKLEARTLIQEMLDNLKHCSLNSGCCHCGDSMDKHAEPMNCGHTPVDMGWSASESWITKADDYLRTPTPEQAGEVELDWRKIAKLAGEHGVRYRTNTSFAAFLSALQSTPPAQPTAEVFPSAPKNPAQPTADAVEGEVQCICGDTDCRLWLEHGHD